MSDGFIRKKVESLTLSEKLVKLRSQYRMSLAEISKATRIQVKYLEALESGDYHGLPAEVYVRGFLRSYARYLGLEDNAFIKLYDKEKHIRSHLGHAPPPQEKTISPVLQRTWVITPRLAAVLLGGVVLLGIFGYLFRELRSFVAEPHLVILTPASGLVTVEESIMIKGKTDVGALVVINDEPVFVNGQGEFQETVALQPGTNTLRVAATNRFDKTKEVLLVIDNNLIPVGGGSAPVPIEINSSQGVEQLKLEIDNVVVWNGPWEAGKRAMFTPSERVVISTDTPANVALMMSGGESLLLDTAHATGTNTFTYTAAELNTRVSQPRE